MLQTSRKELSLQELRICQLDIFKEFHNYCLSNNLCYYMVYGTLLGAVRHKGYIPWDDDIDVAMPRQDYEKLIINYNRTGKDQKVSRCVHIDTNPSYYLDFAKIYDNRTELCEFVNKPILIGAYIDVFPIDIMPDDITSAKIHLRRIADEERLLRTHNKTGGPGRGRIIKSFVHDLERLFVRESRYEVIKRIDSLGMLFRDKTTMHVAIAVGGFSELSDYVPADWYAEPVLLEFENGFYYAPSRAHELLNQWYGDYMTLPPVDQRISHHAFKAYWK